MTAIEIMKRPPARPMPGADGSPSPSRGGRPPLNADPARLTQIRQLVAIYRSLPDLRVKEFAARVGISRKTLWRWSIDPRIVGSN